MRAHVAGTMRRATVARAAAALAAAALVAAAAFAEDAPTPQAIRAARDAVFKRPEFQYRDQGGGGTSIFARIWDWLGSVLRGLHDAYPVLYTGALIAAAVLLVLLIAHLLWTWRVSRQAQFAPEDDPRDLEAALRRLDPAPFRTLALAHAAAGRWEDAVRDLYTALLLTLDRRGALHYAGHKALLDYRIEAATDDAARAALDQFADAYPPGSFGRRPPNAKRFKALVDALDALDPFEAARRT